MNENAAVANICRNRPRSKQHRIVGGLIVGTVAAKTSAKVQPATGEPEVIALDAVHEDADGSVRVQIRLNPRTHAALRVVAKSQNRSVASTLSRYLAQTISFIASKVDA